MNQGGFLEGKLFPMILRYSIPAAASLLITAVYNIVDRIFVGNFAGVSALAGLSVCFPLSYLMIAFGLTCSAGGSSLFSLFAGQGERERMNRVFGNAFVLVCVMELVLTVVLLLLPRPLLLLFGATETAYPYALAYYRIVALGCLFQGLALLFGDFVRVSGKPLTGMCVTGVGAVVNLALDALFVAVLGLGVEGAAWATVIGQGCSALFGGALVLGNRTMVEVSPAVFRPERRLCLRVVSCGFAFWVAQVAMAFITLVYNGQLGRYGGDVAISVYAVVASVMTFVIMPASGISQGIQPILGNCYGAGRYRRVMDAMGQSTALSVGVTCVIWLVVLLFPGAILGAFGATEEMLEIGVTGLRLNFCVTPILGFVMLATTFFQSLGRPAPSILLTLLRQVVVLLPLLAVLPALGFGVNGVFLAQPVSDVAALAVALALVLRERRRMYARLPAA